MSHATSFHLLSVAVLVVAAGSAWGVRSCWREWQRALRKEYDGSGPAFGVVVFAALIPALIALANFIWSATA